MTKIEKEKQQCSVAVNTTLGADGYSALSQTQCCDTECINKQGADTSKKTTEGVKWKNDTYSHAKTQGTVQEG